ncbi:hypothetical protein CYMTET_23772 [Cymbomonas tetramitiformis]|uniref:Uncharacterized protein n=1 Tax=Cymbomonas tetramitiformis TaxID=36881 RepID=A0AAE0FX36_9CHLO|nr:hypothetical protein CYMTET_23772 [Cymbomonas tetramitiformis]
MKPGMSKPTGPPKIDPPTIDLPRAMRSPSLFCDTPPADVIPDADQPYLKFPSLHSQPLGTAQRTSLDVEDPWHVSQLSIPASGHKVYWGPERAAQIRFISPWDSAGPIARLTFDYVRPLLAKGVRKPLELVHLPPVPLRDTAARQTAKIEAAWLREQGRAAADRLAAHATHGGTQGSSRSRAHARSGPPRRAALWRVLYQTYRQDFWEAGFYSALESSSILVQPVVLQQMVEWTRRGESYSTGAGLASCLAALALLQAVVHHKVFYVTMRAGWNLRIGVVGAVHSKLLRLTGDGLRQGGGSAVYNLVANDVLRFDNYMPFLHFGWLAMIELVVIFILTSLLVGLLAAFAGISGCLLSILLQVHFSREYARLRATTGKQTDRRLRASAEVLLGMLSLKVYNWEDAFKNLLGEMRAAEHATILRSQAMKSVGKGLYFATPPVASFLTFLVVYLSGDSIQVEVAYAVVGLLAALRLSVGKNFAMAVAAGPECFVSMARIERFLDLEEPLPASRGTRLEGARPADPGRPLVEVAGATWLWPGSTPEMPEGPKRVAVSGVDVAVRAGEVLMVVGPVACGKSAFLQALLGELQLQAGAAAVHGRVAYSPQESWILAGSVKYNVLYGGLVYDLRRYRIAMAACALRRDVSHLPRKDNTDIGEMGVNLSGGQKARVSLARVVYSNPDVALLDDPLAAVDATVAAHLFHAAVRGELANRGTAVVLVTHQQQFLHLADKLMVLRADGSVAGTGTPEEMEAAGLVTLAPVAERSQSVDLTLAEAPTEEDATKALRLCPIRPVAHGTRGALDSHLRACATNGVRATSFLEISSSWAGLPLAQAEDMKQSAADKAAMPPPAALVHAEDRHVGSVEMKTWVAYIRAAGLSFALFVLMLFVAAQVLLMLSDYWLKVWIEGGQSGSDFFVFSMLCLGVTLAGLLAPILFFYGTMQASTNLHGQGVARLLKAPMWFFTANPHGRILNRLSSDLAQVDELLPIALHDAVQLGIMVLGSLTLICVVIPWLLLLVPPLVLAMSWLRWYTVRSMQELKRLENITRSPVFAMFNSTLNGLIPLRAFKLQSKTQGLFVQLLEDNARAWYWWLLCNRWIGFWLDMLCFMVVGITAFAIVARRDSLDAGLAGFVLVYVISLCGLLQYTVRQHAQAQTYMTSSERLLHYAHDLPQEADKKIKSPWGWPSAGSIDLRDVCVRYREKGRVYVAAAGKRREGPCPRGCCREAQRRAVSTWLRPVIFSQSMVPLALALTPSLASRGHPAPGARFPVEKPPLCIGTRASLLGVSPFVVRGMRGVSGCVAGPHDIGGRPCWGAEIREA